MEEARVRAGGLCPTYNCSEHERERERESLTALLLGAKRSHNWQITHWAEDAAEQAEALLHTLITAEEGESKQGGLNTHTEGWPKHWHPLHTPWMCSDHRRGQTRGEGEPPNPRHVYAAKARLRRRGGGQEQRRTRCR